MKIKQQNRIKDFLTREYGRGKAVDLFARQESELNKAIENTCGKTKNQMKTLTNTVLPRVALYKALQEKGLTWQVSWIRVHCLVKLGIVRHNKADGKGNTTVPTTKAHWYNLDVSKCVGSIP